MVLYFVQQRSDEVLNRMGASDAPIPRPQEYTTDLINPILKSQLDAAGAEARTAILEFKYVFRSDIPEELPPHRAIDHEINTNNEAPSNRNAYPLSVVQ
jgi:hypothetical protein